MGFNISKETQLQLQNHYKAPWIQNGTRYLDVKISDNSRDLLPNNVLPLMKNKSDCWRKLNLSWWGRLAAIKMNLLPLLLFLFQNLVVHSSQTAK